MKNKIELIPVNEFGSEITVGGYGFDKFIEKPKQETLEEYAYKNPVYSREEVLELLQKSFPDKAISGVFNISASKQIYSFEQSLRELGKSNAEKIMKQEILEEGAENKKNLYYCKQSMNPYSVEEYSHTAYEKGFIEGYQESTKWQSERMYSEEEVQVKLYECLGHFAQKHNIIINGSEIDQWFEQFKKK